MLAVSDMDITERLIEDLEDLINYISTHFLCNDSLAEFPLPDNFIDDLLDKLENAHKELEKALL